MSRQQRIPVLDGNALDALGERVRGELLLPHDEGYDEARALWNGMIDRRPGVIVRASGTADVVAAVEFAREQGLELAVHGGGHNVAGNAVTDGGVMLDLSTMNGVFVDPAARTARVEGGATLGNVDHETQLFGLAVPFGAVSETGVAGLTLNGGYGHLSRAHGLACDNVRSMQVVTASGEVLTASAEEHPDLFWALRGGGGNFGVVTAFEFELYEVGPEVYVLFTWFHANDGSAVFERVREWVESAPPEAGVLPFVGHVPELEEFPASAWGEPAVALLGSYLGDVADGPSVYSPLVEGLQPLADMSGPMPYEELQQLLDEDYPDGLRYYWKSIFLDELTDEAVDLMLRYNESAPSALSTIDVWCLGGVVADPPQDATAFWHRDKPFMLNFEANWTEPEDDDANVSWGREGFAEAEVLPVASGRYGNFPGMAEDPVELLFGENYDRLVAIKRRYDPENLFHRNQNIRPEPAV